MQELDVDELIKTQLSNYMPVDLTNLKPRSDINTSRELEKEARHISEVLSGKSKCPFNFSFIPF